MTDCWELSLKRGFKLITLNIFSLNDNIGLNFFEKIFVFWKINRLWLTKSSIVNHRGVKLGWWCCSQGLYVIYSSFRTVVWWTLDHPFVFGVCLFRLFQMVHLWRIKESRHHSSWQFGSPPRRTVWLFLPWQSSAPNLLYYFLYFILFFCI